MMDVRGARQQEARVNAGGGRGNIRWRGSRQQSLWVEGWSASVRDLHAVVAQLTEQLQTAGGGDPE